MILVVAEKPSVARDIARVLKAGEKENGYYTGNGYAVTWALGHLVSQVEPGELDERYKKWRSEDLPILPDEIPLKALPHGLEQYKTVKKLMLSRSTEKVICATDAGREGELIFRYIYQHAGCVKQVERLWISSMTDEAIREGFRKLRPSSFYDNLYDSAKCRSEADWLVGMNASRAYSLRYNARLSVGRVQTPTLALLVRRKHEIDSFVPEKYWVVTADFAAPEKAGERNAPNAPIAYSGTYFNPDEPKKQINKAETAEKIADDVRGKRAVVKSAESVKKSEIAPQLYDLTTLQRDANRMYGLTAQQTLDAAQSLYEKYKLVTYPRTDSRYLTQDFAPKLPQSLANLPRDLQPHAEELLRKPLPKSRRVFDDGKVSDHHAIVPTGANADIAKLPERERKIYDLIARRLVAAFMPEHKYEQTTIITESEGHLFRSTGRVTLADGWKAVYKTDDTDKPLPKVKPGDVFNVQDVHIKEDTTKPPPKLTDATLLSAMENAGQKIEDEELREAMKKGGLGTPATRAAILERLIEVGYAMREGKAVVATEKGVRLICVAPPILTDPVLTGKWEKALSQIADGTGDSGKFRLAARKLAASVVNQAVSSSADVTFPSENYAKTKSKTARPAGKTYTKRAPNKKHSTTAGASL